MVNEIAYLVLKCLMFKLQTNDIRIITSGKESATLKDNNNQIFISYDSLLDFTLKVIQNELNLNNNNGIFQFNIDKCAEIVYNRYINGITTEGV